MDKTKIATDVFNRSAASYQEKFMDVDLYADTLDLFCASIASAAADILEIACGPGNITRYLLSKRPDFKILGIDLAPNMLDLAKINNPGAEFQLMDARDISRIDKKYDGVICGFGLPYLSGKEAAHLISDTSGLLKSGGVLYLSTMEDDYSKSGFQYSSTGGRLYIYYHEADYLTRAIKENDFEIVDIQRKDYPAADGTTTKDLVIIARK